MTLTAANDGVQADGDLTVTGGTFDITANGGHTTALTDDSASCKGLKAGKTLTVSGGTVNVDSADDALHANDVTVSGGTLTSIGVENMLKSCLGDYDAYIRKQLAAFPGKTAEVVTNNSENNE